MIVSLIAAVARNGVIGRGGALPWRLPADLAHFRRQTTGHHVIMGRRTWESLPRALPGRVNLVLSRRGAATPVEGATMLPSLEAALALAREAGEDEAFVIGGAALYRAALPLARRTYLTRVEANVPGDTHMPPLGGGWVEVARELRAADDRNPFALTFSTLERGAAEPPGPGQAT